jgi:hypothetical protein
MPRFPGKPVKIGDTFTDTVFLNGAGMEAGGQTVFELEEVRDKLARFKLRYTGSTSGGGAAATDPASVQPYRGDFYEIFSDPATGDRFIWHNNLLGTGYYLYGETGMRYYLPSD